MISRKRSTVRYTHRLLAALLPSTVRFRERFSTRRHRPLLRRRRRVLRPLLRRGDRVGRGSGLQLQRRKAHAPVSRSKPGESEMSQFDPSTRRVYSARPGRSPKDRDHCSTWFRGLNFGDLAGLGCVCARPMVRGVIKSHVG